MKKVFLVLMLCPCLFHAQLVFDDFEGSGTIDTWTEDNCGMQIDRVNPFPEGINPSATVLEYHDTGGQYANIRFDVPRNFDFETGSRFTFKVYVLSTGLTGTQPNQISIKLQDGRLPEPWVTQSEIIKPLALDVWQEVTVDFAQDSFINLDPNSLPPTERGDFNRVLFQVNGENNNDHVLAFIDDVSYDGEIPKEPVDPVYDELVWFDEFDVDGAVDSTKWHAQTIFPIGNSWFNGEIQHYTDRIENAEVKDGALHITARRESYTDQGVTKEFTSARLNSKYAFTYGKIEVRAKLPSGVGTFPAIWMLGKNIDELGGYWQTQGFGTKVWPACGEIDIMEHWGDNQDYISSATHTPSSFGGTVNVAGQVIPNATTEFHTYELLWSPERLKFSVDSVVHFIYEPDDKNLDTWPFDLEHYFLFNVAMLPNVDPNFMESAMEIDYIRVYQEGLTTGTKEYAGADLQIYPNPSSQDIRVELDQELRTKGLMQIFDLNGKCVWQKSIQFQNGVATAVDLGNLKAGMYMVKVTTEGQEWSGRLIRK